MDKTLTVVGSGIKFLSHLTVEAKAHIKKASKVLYLFNDPAMQLWIQKENPNAESLDPIYQKHSSRLEAYRAISHYILRCLEKYKHLCVVLYGHPTVFARPALEAAYQAEKLGYRVFILPGISAEDCLFADLKINPGSSGCQSFEATDFLIHRRVFDPRSHLILWQVGIIGVLEHPKEVKNKQAAKILMEYLAHWYDVNHLLTLYEAAQYPGLLPCIEQFALNELPDANFTRISTLYIPPLGKSFEDLVMMEALGML